MLKLVHNSIVFSIFVVAFISSLNCTPAEAYERSNPNGNITVKWDILQWTADGYIAGVMIYNFQNSRQIEARGMQLGWSWAKNTMEIIWKIVGAKITTGQGDCSRLKQYNPLSCSKNLTISDLKPYNKSIASYCRCRVFDYWYQYQPNPVSSFLITVGAAGTTNSTVKLPTNVVFKASNDVYACGPAKVTMPTKYTTCDGRRTTQALMTWNVTCFYTNVKRST